eukprot:m.243043 g.243043  ORF g.243043 m.243043 type:complete len:174 (+) comp26854_c0_seq1:129-650(+)
MAGAGAGWKQESVQQSRDEGRSSLRLTFGAGPLTDFVIVFRNKYTASVTVKALVAGSWQTCMEDFALMPSAHTEDGGQSVFTLSADKFLLGTAISAVELILYQPSPHWLAYGLCDLRVYTRVAAPAVTVSKALDKASAARRIVAAARMHSTPESRAWPSSLTLSSLLVAKDAP